MTPGAKPDPTTAFFDDLAARAHEPSLHLAEGSLRFDVRDGDATEHWYLAMSHGDVKVSHKASRADAVVRVDRKLFERMVRGTANTMTALLRGVIELEGDLMLLGAVDRLFPGPPESQASFFERKNQLAGQ